MKKQVLTEEYYGHIIEVQITETQPELQTKLEFIPDNLKSHIFDLLANNIMDGDFDFDDCYEYVDNKCQGYKGSWRVLRLDAQLLYNIVMWYYNHYSDEALTEELFIGYFGQNDGKHFYNKWQHTHKKDLLLMIAYFGRELDHSQTFCNMLQEQVEKYVKNRAQKNSPS